MNRTLTVTVVNKLAANRLIVLSECHVLEINLGARDEAAKVQPKNVWARRAEPEKFWRHNFLNCILDSYLWTLRHLNILNGIT